MKHVLRMKRKFVALGTVLVGLIGLSSVVQAQGSPAPFTSATRYDVLGQVTGTIAPDPDGAGPLRYAATRTTYDTAGNPVLVELGELANWQSEAVPPTSWPGFTVFSRVETTYDVLKRKTGQITKGSDGIATAAVQYSYDAVGRLECTAVRMNTAIYNSLPASACSLGAQGSLGSDRITQNVYDAAGRLTQVRKAVGTSIETADVTYSFTPNGKPEYVIDAVGNRAQLQYDGYDRQSKWIFPSTTKSAAYNPSSQATALATAGSLNAGDFEQYGYDANNNRLSLRKRNGSTISWQFDALNRPWVKIVPELSGLSSTHTRDIYYGYDLQGHMLYARFDGATGEGVTNGFDGFGRMTASTLAMDGASRSLALQYDKDSNRTRITHPDGAYFTMGYDGMDRLNYASWWASASGTVPFVSISYTPAGLRNILNRASSYTDYAYHPDLKLSGITQRFAGNAGNVTQSFTYNPASQILARTTSNDIFAWTGHYNVDRNYTTNGLNQYSAASSATFTYDLNGNLIADGSTNFTYDVENRLVSASGTRNATLRYDPLGRLYEIVGASETTRLLHDSDHVVAEYASNGTMLRRYMWGPGDDEPILWDEGGALNCSATRFLHPDHQGSIIAIADCSGNQTNVNRYDEYGIPQTGNVGRFQYTGQAWIPDLGMSYYKARMYSPTLGRFMQTDPVGYKDQFNLYAYVANDPVNKTDPDGKQAQAPAAAAGCAVTGPACPVGAVVGIVAATAATACAASDACRGAVVSAVRAAGDGVRSLVNRATSSSASSSEARRQDGYAVRVQAQGTSLRQEGSVPLASQSPIPAGAVHGALAGTAAQLSSKDQAALAPAFARAGQWVDRVAAGGGIGPVGSTSFTIPGVSGREMRVDIEVQRGPINIVEPR